MSGGHFDYWQSYIDKIADEVEKIIRLNGKPIPYDDLDDWDREHYDPQDPPIYYDLSPKVIAEFRKGLKILRKAYVYAQRIDWLLSDDDGEESFFERLEEELKAIK